MRSLLLAALLAAPVRAGVDASGYLKTLYSRSRSPLSGREHWGDLNRARLQLKGEKTGDAWALRAEAHYDHELRLGSERRSTEARLFDLGEPERFLSMDHTVSSGTGAHWRHRLYRGFVEARAGPWTARFGRQRVAWGTGKLWNPVDVLNPYQPTSLEREERLGVDALHLRRGLGNLGQAEAVWALGRSWIATDLLARGRGNAGGADLAFLGGKVAGSTGSWLAGGDAAWDLGGGTVHAEVSYTDLVQRTPFWKGMAGYEYSFSTDPPLRALKDVWINAEYFHNGRGRRDPLRYEVGLLRTGREVALAKDYAGLALKKELHPLFSVELVWLQNLGDASRFLSPTASWNALDDLHLAAGWQAFGGAPRSEYGRVPNTAFVQAQWFF